MTLHSFSIPILLSGESHCHGPHIFFIVCRRIGIYDLSASIGLSWLALLAGTQPNMIPMAAEKPTPRIIAPGCTTNAIPMTSAAQYHSLSCDNPAHDKSMFFCFDLMRITKET
jgi:hypothetical protein